MSYRRIAILSAVPVLAGLFSVIMGRDANWDFLNYRWYNPYSLLHGRLATDVVISGHASFFNPLLELPFYLLATHAPAVLAGFAVAALDGACFIPLFLLAERTLEIGNKRHRFLAAFLIGLSGLLGGGALGQIGVISWDMSLGLLTLSSLVVLLSGQQAAITLPPSRVMHPLLLAGFLAGSAAGLKLTAAIYPLGIVIAIFTMSRGGLSWRIIRCAWFSAGTAAGIALCGGFWMVRLYLAFGNPTMPFFNGVFHSPYAAEGSNRDSTFIPHDWKSALMFPFLFTVNSRHVAEYDFRDSHIALAYALIPVAAICLAIRRVSDPLIALPALKFLSVAFLASYAAWEYMFSIYRYAIPLEMLAPLIVVGALGCVPVAWRTRWIVVCVVLAVSAATLQAGFNRRPWQGDYVTVTMPFTIPDDALVLMPGTAPVGFVVPSLPPTVAALRVGSALAKGNRFGDVMAERVAKHRGPFYVIDYPAETEAAVATLAEFGLSIDRDGCRAILSNVADPVSLCPAVRR